MAKSRHSLASSALFGLLSAASSCGSADDDQSSSEAQESDVKAGEVDGRLYALASARGFEAIQVSDVSLLFRDGELSINAGCNSQFGSFHLRAGRLIISGLASTEKDCTLDLQAQDVWLAEFLGMQPSAKIAGKQLTLETDRAALVFRESGLASRTQ